MQHENRSDFNPELTIRQYFEAEINLLLPEEIFAYRNFVIDHINIIGTYSSEDKLGYVHRIESYQYLSLLDARLKKILPH